MEVEVRVTDGRGRPIPDLTREDFELLENGQAQRVATFEYVAGPLDEAPSGPAAERNTDRAEAEPTEAVSAMRRSTFIYIAARGRREDRLRIYNAIREFLDENLAPDVFVSIQGSPFTDSRAELQAELEAQLEGRERGAGLVDRVAEDMARDIAFDDRLDQLFEGQLDEANQDFQEMLDSRQNRQEFYRRVRMYEYIDLIRALAAFPGKKMVVLFATGLPVDEDNLDVMKVLEDEATRARVRFYVSDTARLAATPPGGDAEGRGNLASLFGDRLSSSFVSATESRQDDQDGLYELARRTGGRAVLNSNDFGEVFEVVNRESRNYYLLGYYPEDTEQRGRLRRIRVRVKRQGLRVSHQRGYYEERPFALMSKSERGLHLRQALEFDTPFADLPLRVDHNFFRNSEGKPVLVYSVGLHAGDMPAAASGKGREIKLAVVARAFPQESGSGRPRQPIFDPGGLEMTVPLDEYERLGSDPNSWLHYASQMPLAPGRYTWKVIVRDEHSGLLGSYQTEIGIPELKPGVGASTLLLTSRIDDVAGAPPPKKKRKLPEDVLEVAGSRFYATATRVFLRGEPIFLLYDIYNPGAEALATPPSAALALYQAGEPVDTLPVRGHQTVAEPEAGRVRYLAALDTDELPTGSYALAALLPAEGTDKPVIYRRFEVVERAEP